MSSTTITITKFNGTNYAHWAIEMVLLLEQKQVYGIIKGFNDKPEEPAANATAAERATLKDWMNRHGVASWTILLGMEPRIQVKYTVVVNAKTISEKLTSAYRSKLKLNIFEIRERPLEHQATGLRRCRQLCIVDRWENQGSQSLRRTESNIDRCH